mgnify:CR=1 FL=1
MTYPEMDAKIVGLLRISTSACQLYAADRIEELERAIAEKDRCLDSFMWRRPPSGYQECRECDVLEDTPHQDFCRSGKARKAGHE